jgi:hypothetical protein
MILNKELLNYQDKLFWVYRKVKQTQVKSEYIGDLKEHWMCDLVVRDRNTEDSKLLFLREITDAVIINS